LSQPYKVSEFAIEAANNAPVAALNSQFITATFGFVAGAGASGRGSCALLESAPVEVLPGVAVCALTGRVAASRIQSAAPHSLDIRSP
jgi:hypothetical protein